MQRNFLEESRLFEFQDGFKCYSHSSLEEMKVLYNETYRDNEYFKNDIKLHDGACLFDVGANIGLFTICANRMFKRLTTYAFEPMPPTFKILLNNLQLHGLKQVRALQFGLSDCDCSSKEFTYFYNQPGNSTIQPESKEIHREGMLATHRHWQIDLAFKNILINAPVRTLSSVIDEYNIRVIDLLKIDVEGAEQAILAGVANNHWRMIRQVVLEVHDAPAHLSDIVARLGSYGFQVTIGSIKPNWAGNVNVYCIRSCE